MNKDQLRDMREILANEANGRPFPKIGYAAVAELARLGYVERVGETHKSTEQGRAAVLAAGKKA